MSQFIDVVPPRMENSACSLIINNQNNASYLNLTFIVKHTYPHTSLEKIYAECVNIEG